MRRAAPFLLVALVLGLGLWGARALREEVARADAVEPAEAQSVGQERVATPPAAPTAVDGAPDRTAVVEGADGRDVLEVRVVEAATGAPHPGALVRRVLRDELRGPAVFAALTGADPTDLTFLDGLGVTRVADEGGVARFPRHAGDAVFAATDGDAWWGVAEHEAGDPGPVEVRLLRRAGLLVRALDATGRPARDVPLVLSPVDWSLPGGPPEAVTDALGEARVASWPSFVARWRETHEQVFVGAAIPVAEPHWATLPVEHDPDDVVVLHLPPTGTVLVQVVGAGADPRGVVTLHSLSPSGASHFASGPPSAPLERGVARFPHVELELELAASAELAGATGGLTRRVPGPSRAGETIEVVLDLLARPVLVGRLVEADGAPAASGDGRLRFRLQTNRRESEAGFTVDAEGHFRFVLGPGAGAGEVGWLRVRRTAVEAGAEVIAGEVQVALPSPLTPGEHDLGVLVLAAPLPLASGVVVDALGTPVPGVEVRASYLVVEDPEDEGEWFEDWNALGTSDAQGRFRVFASEQADRWSLGVFADGYFLPEPVEVAPGADGVRLVLHQAGSLAASWLLPQGLPNDAFSVSFRGGGASLGEVWGESTSDGSWVHSSWYPLPPGSYGLAIRLVGTDAILLDVPDIEVLPGPATSDPRVNGVDLARYVDVVHLTVLGVDGMPFEGDFEVSASDGRRFRRLRLFGDGPEYPLPAPKGEPLELLVRAGGHRVERVRAATADVTVELRAPLTVTLRVYNAQALERDGLRLAIWPRRLEDVGLRTGSRYGPLFVGEDGAATFVVDWPGDFEFTMGWRAEPPDRRAGKAALIAEQYAIEDGMNGAVLALDTPAKLFEE